MSLTDRLARGVKATFAAEMLRLISQAAIILLLTRVFLDPDGYGLLRIAIAVFAVVTLVGTLGVPKSVAKFIAEYRERDQKQIRYLLRQSLCYLSVVLGFVCVGFYLLSDTIATYYGEPALVPLFAIGIGYLVFKVYNGYLVIVFQGLGRVPLTAAVKTITSVGQLTAIVAFVGLGFGVVGALGGFIVGYALGVFFGAVLLVRILKSYPATDEPESGLSRRLFEYSLPLTASQSGNILYKRADTLMVGFFLTPAAAAFYEVAKQVADFIMAPADSLGFTVAPTFGEHKSGSNLEAGARVYERSLEYILLLYLPAIAGIVLLAEPGIRFVFGPDFAGAAPVLQVLSVFILFQAIDKITNDSLDYLGRATERAIGKGVTAVLNFLLNLALIPTIGVVGAAISTSVCFGLMVLYNVYLMHTELPLSWAHIGRSIGLTTAITAAMTVAVVLLQPLVTGLVSLLAVVAAGIVVWGAVSVASGVVDVADIRTYI